MSPEPVTTAAIYETEVWPSYVLNDAGSYGEQVEIPEALARRYHAAREAWEAVQGELSELYGAATEGRDITASLALLVERGSFAQALVKTGTEAWKRASESKGTAGWVTEQQ